MVTVTRWGDETYTDTRWVWQGSGGVLGGIQDEVYAHLMMTAGSKMNPSLWVVEGLVQRLPMVKDTIAHEVYF